MIDAREVHVSCCVNVEGVQMGGRVGYVLEMGIVWRVVVLKPSV